MKKRADRLEPDLLAIHMADRVLNGILAVVMILALLYSGYGLWDDWMVYHGAGVDSELLKYKPDTTDADESNPTLSDLQKINPDVCAWLTVDDTNIDYPVVQGKTNTTYINRDVYGEFSMSGSIFLDYRNQADFSDFYSLVYGHHMAGKVMFGEITDFQKKSYFDKHASGTLCLPDATYQIEWFACVKTDAYDYEVFTPVERGQKEKSQYLLQYIKEHALQYREINVTEDEQIIGLSTCLDSITNGRVLLFGRMEQID
jgi:sortase B